jgi:hypothetical protein
MVLSKRLQGEQAPEKKGVPLCSWCSSHTSLPHMPHNSLAVEWQYLHLGTGRIFRRELVISSFLLQGLHNLLMIGEMRTPHSEQAVAVPAPNLSDAVRLSPRHCLFPGSIDEIQLRCRWEN